jgi:hypothetical protein
MVPRQQDLCVAKEKEGEGERVWVWVWTAKAYGEVSFFFAGKKLTSIKVMFMTADSLGMTPI